MKEYISELVYNGIDKDIIIDKVSFKFNLSLEQAEKVVNIYWYLI